MRNPGRAGVGVGVGVVDVDDVCGGKADCAAAGMEGEGARDMLPERSAVWRCVCVAGTDCRWLCSVPRVYGVSILFSLLVFPSSQLLPDAYNPPAHP